MKKVPSINASSFFHFTRKISSLKLILKNGVRFSYAFERYSDSLISNFCNTKCSYQDLGVAIPMICFCDTPLTRAYKHMDKYGDYMIGFNKDYLISCYGNALNPVFYIQSLNVEDAIEEISSIYAETCKEYDCLTKITPYDESTQMRITSLGLRKYNLRLLVGLRKPMSFYDEREWRIIYDDNKGQVNEWKWGLPEAEYERIKKDINNELSEDFDSYITVFKDNICDAISHIVVKKESQIPKIVDYIMESKKLFGYEYKRESDIDEIKKVKMNLVSKITSVKRIISDY